jgi:hypothetical protein
VIPDKTTGPARHGESAADSGSNVAAYSPVTQKAYTMSCSAGNRPTCTGGNKASVYFP